MFSGSRVSWCFLITICWRFIIFNIIWSNYKENYYYKIIDKTIKLTKSRDVRSCSPIKIEPWHTSRNSITSSLFLAALWVWKYLSWMNSGRFISQGNQSNSDIGPRMILRLSSTLLVSFCIDLFFRSIRSPVIRQRIYPYFRKTPEIITKECNFVKLRNKNLFTILLPVKYILEITVTPVLRDLLSY